MKEIIKFGFILMLVTLIGAGSLSWVNNITKPRILEQEKKALDLSLSIVLSGTENGIIIPVDNRDQSVYYEGYRDKDKKEFIGYALPVVATGYSSKIRAVVGFDSTGRILAINVLSQKETPGLGTKCEEIRKGESTPWFQAQFAGMDAATIAVDKDGGTIESITGATITSRAITDAVRDSVTNFLNRIRKRN